MQSSQQPAVEQVDRLKSDMARIFTAHWIPRLIEKACNGDSPPEQILAMVLNALLFDRISDGSIQIDQQVELPTSKSGHKFRPDFILTIEGEDKKFIFECDGWGYHRRNQDEYAYEIKRERELTLMGFTVIRFSAKELFEDPWECGTSTLTDMAEMLTEPAKLVLSEDLRHVVHIQPEPETQAHRDDPSLVATLLQAIREFHEHSPYPTFSACRRFVYGKASRSSGDGLRKLKNFGVAHGRGTVRRELTIAYDQFKRLVDTDQPAPTSHSPTLLAAEPDRDIQAIANAYVRANLPTDGEHAELRKKHPRAYMKWESEEENILLGLVDHGKTASSIARILGRQTNSIEKRIDRLRSKDSK